MKIFNKLFKFITNSLYRFNILSYLGFFNHWADEKFIRKNFKLVFNYELDLNNPQTFNEKLQWLKLYDRNPLYTIMVDKYKVKEYVANIIGKQHLIPTLGVYNSADEIDFNKLPNKFVLKCNHNSGMGMCICKDKSKLDIKKVKKELSNGLKQNYYLINREWPYKNVSRKIIAEQYMEDSTQQGLNDYKLMCFNGKCKCLFVCSDRFTKTGLKVTFYDINWNVMPFERHYPKTTRPIKKPSKFNEMIKLAEKLSKDISFVRVDFYEINGKVYFGELTFFPGSGFEEFTPFEWDEKIGDWLVLPSKKI